MAPADLLTQYGYLALFIGCLLEGETLLVLAGVAAHGGYLWLPTVVAVAFIGGTLGDQILFFFGRRSGGTILQRWPRFQQPAARVQALVARHSSLLIVGVRFMYGLRLIGPIVIGMSAVSPLRFAILNMVGAALWATSVAGVGYLFGHAIEWLLADLALFERLALTIAVIVAVVLFLLHSRRSRPRD
jgi:membrane protein DedA with SNARE-associated domain